MKQRETVKRLGDYADRNLGRTEAEIEIRQAKFFLATEILRGFEQLLPKVENRDDYIFALEENESKTELTRVLQRVLRGRNVVLNSEVVEHEMPNYTFGNLVKDLVENREIDDYRRLILDMVKHETDHNQTLNWFRNEAREFNNRPAVDYMKK